MEKLAPRKEKVKDMYYKPFDTWAPFHKDLRTLEIQKTLHKRLKDRLLWLEADYVKRL